ncbi:MAG: DNA mismatch repair endonuclease MutL [Oscillospiraceae bacterium]|nr:DNA mismatch repair endonuclease MutL [Oscillospiraceae bacterium]
MPQIQCLPSHVADLIAAGEVVERPASVAKELLENAIDAGATAIVVELERGGLTYLRITDNGCGIAPEELPTAFLRHATSKLRTADDLAAIGTLGFRGEALAAISAVSRIDVFTRRKGADSGAVLHLEGGVPGEVTETGCPEGTTICVRDLFYNTPARMKFMKKDSAEGAAVSGIVQHLALSHPDISFKMIRDGAEVLHTPGDGKLLSAIYAAMGRDFAMGLLPVKGCGGEVEVQGFVTKPLHGHGTRARQVFFVNGRFVKSQLLQAALEEAYRNRLLKGKFPGCVVHITLPKDMVDVNVHPAKTVVKFVSDKAVFDAFYYTVRDALDGENKPEAPAPRQESFYQTMTAQQFKEKTAPAPEVKKPLGSYTARPAAPMKPAIPAKPAALAFHDVAPQKDQPFTATVPDRSGREMTYHITPPAAVEEKPAQTAVELPAEPAPVAEPVQQQLEAQAAPWRMVGEVLRTYIICEDEADNVWLIDKHAAHERIRFDALKADDHPLMSQMLLAPLTVTLAAEEAAAVLENLETLHRFGFVCEDFGDGTVLVREVPADIRTGDAASTLEELAQKLLLGRIDPEGVRDELYHTMACKSAIKAGMVSNEKELAALVGKVQSGEIKYCPHGRPVAVKLSKYEVEKMFKRA